MGVILFIVSAILGIITFPIGFIWSFIRSLFTWNWKEFNEDYLELAISVDETLNVALIRPLNFLLLKKGAEVFHSFGSRKETVSYVIGKNYIYGNLSKFGHICRKMLYSFDKDHVIKAVMNHEGLSYEEVMEIYNDNN